jgi:hypothetical protein
MISIICAAVCLLIFTLVCPDGPWGTTALAGGVMLYCLGIGIIFAIEERK